MTLGKNDVEMDLRTTDRQGKSESLPNRDVLPGASCHGACVLVGHDFTAASRKAAWQGASEAVERGGTLLLVHVTPIPAMGPGLWVDSNPGMYLHAGVQEHLRARLEEVAGDLREEFPQLPIDTVVLDGRAATSLVQVAREVGADRIVVGTHGRTGLSHLLLGSVAEEIIRLAPVPVLVVPDTEDP